MAARSIWTGSITFGLVNIPVKLYSAVHEQTVHFHMLHDQDNVRLTRRMVCPADGKEVHMEHVVKGYEIAPDQYVVIQQEELDALAPEKSRSIQILDFVDQKDIDPVYYDRPYYVAPAEHSAKPYRLLVDALASTKKVGIAKFVMRNKEYVAALRASEGALVLETMHFADEVGDVSEIPGIPVHARTDDRELKMAEQLIQSLSTTFDPTHYKDEYRQRVMQMLEAKARGEEIVTQPQVEEKPGRVVNLMAALEASLAQARTKVGAAAVKSSHGHAAATAAKHAPVASHKGESRRTQTRRRKSA